MFKQRRFLTTFEFDIQEDFVAVKERDLTASRAYKVPFENIAAEPAEVTLASRPRLWTTVILSALAIITGTLALVGADVERGAWILWGGLAVLAGASFAHSRQTYLVFKAGDPPLVVMKGQPTPAALATFVREVQDRKRAYLAQRYLIHTPEGPAADALHKLAWLRDEGVISDSEFEVLKADVMRRVRDAAPSPWSNN